MKRTKVALTLGLAALLSFGGLTACGKKSTSASTDSTTADSTVAVSKITYPTVDPVLVNADFDLDTVVTVTLADGTTNHDFKVTCASDKVTLTGHVFKATAPGSYTLAISSGDKNVKLVLDVKTETGMALIPFFKQLDSNPLNYTCRQVKYNSTTGAFDYDDMTLFHNPKYFAEYNETNPGELDKSGDPNSTILATLSNGKSYWGALDSTGKPVFDAGAVNFTDYYITQDLAVSGSDFTSTFDASGNESISAPASVTTAFIESAFGNSTSRLTGYSVSTTEVLDVTTDSTTKAITAVTMELMLTPTAGGDDVYFAMFTLKDIGATSIDFMETAITDASYVPADITAPEVVTEFAAVNTAANYTTTMSLYASDSSGVAIPTATVAATPANYNYASMFGTDGLGYRQTTTVTSDGVYAKEETLDIATTAAAATATFSTQSAYFNRDGKAYKAIYDSKTKATTTTEITGTTDVWTVENAKAYTTKAVTEAGVNSTEWTKKTVSGTTTSFEGKVGDNDGTTAKNVLFQQMFDQYRFIAWGSTDPETIGTYFTSAVDFSKGDKHALTLYSDWASFAVDSSTHSISAKAVVYLPIGSVTGSAYMVCEYTISAVGTTTNDFSAFKVA